MLRLSPPALLELEKNDHWTLPLLVLDIESFQIFAATHNLNIQNSTIKVYLLRLSLYLSAYSRTFSTPFYRRYRHSSAQSSQLWLRHSRLHNQAQEYHADHHDKVQRQYLRLEVMIYRQ